MTAIKQQDFIQSVADTFLFVSVYHPIDFIKAMGIPVKAGSQPPRMPLLKYRAFDADQVCSRGS